MYILYAPDICDSKHKFAYASSKNPIKKKIPNINREFQINDWADLSEEQIIQSF